MRRVAYFVNQYPAPSHTFIRREVLALEKLGWRVQRFAIRHGEGLVEREDQTERERTSALLPLAPLEFAEALLRALLRPRRTLRGTRIAVQMSLRSERGFLRTMACLPQAIVLLRRLERLGIPHVHAHFGTNSTAVVRVVHAMGGPTFSFSSHGPFELEPPFNWCTAEKIQEAVFVAAISSFARAQLMRVSAPEHWHKIHVVRCGLELMSGAESAAPIPSDPRLVCVGRFSAEKGHLVLLRAASHLAEHQIPFHLYLVGDGPLRPALENEVSRLGLSKLVTFTGWIDEKGVRQQLDDSRGLVVSSFSEGLPLALIESGRAARPAVATQIGGIPEFVLPGVSGWLVPPGDDEALATAMHALLTLPGPHLEAMGRASFEIVRMSHDLRREAAKLSTLLEAACDEAASDLRPPSGDSQG
jgi:glycosyltransferase involved in cell wall biosynthesis